ncbi:META domain-containing protein [Deinococcus planocerae]|uniref:META domain-containing protein n=1 Tax=Deinococcus planocerae TaxID=1737569 RepID=UPI000C7EF272|nr:META domain-containing protein [Deinococcus planocerae]
MRPFLLPLALATLLPAAHAATASPLSGTWQLTHVQGLGGGHVSPGTAYLVIADGTVQGRFGCGGFDGSAQAADSRVALNVRPLAPTPGERCPFAIPEAFLAALNGAEQYVVGGGAGQLVLFSKTTRLTFERPGGSGDER